MKASQLVGIELGGVTIQAGTFSYQGEREPAITIRLVLGCDSDKKLAAALPIHEDLEAGPVKFTVTRVRRTVDSDKPNEAVYELWD